MSSTIKDILELSKVKITFAVAFTTITGYIVAEGHYDMTTVLATIGIFFMACGASVINHIQERRTDKVMERTQNRPLPSGRFKVGQAWILAAFHVLVGSIILGRLNILALLLSWLALIWYNLVYTVLKKHTPHAVIPGSLIGAIPPLVGWAATDTTLLDSRAWALALFFFLWQIPHFYLLSMKYGEQYRKAGIPTLKEKYSEPKMKKLIFFWVISSAISAFLLVIVGVPGSLIGKIILLLSSVGIILIFMKPILHPTDTFKPIRYFLRINYYALVVIIVLNLDVFI